MDLSGEGLRDFLMQVIALIILALPLFLLPAMLKFSAGLLGRIYNGARGVMYNNLGGKQAESVGQKIRGAAGDATKRGARNKAVQLGQHSEGWGKRKNEKGEWVDREGRGARTLRRLGRGVGAATLYPSRRKEEIDRQNEMSNRIQEERLNELAAETDEHGNPTARAQAFAMRAAGPAGEEGAERIRRLALERKKKAYVEDVGRESSNMVTMGATDSGAYYYEFDEKGNAVSAYSDHGRAMTAIARGDTTVGVIKAGQERSVENAKKNLIRGDNSYKRDAAIKRLWDIGDGNGLGLSLYGGKHRNDLTGEDEYVAPISDEAFSDSVQWMDAGKIAPKLSHLVTNDNGLNGVSGEAMVNWHGNEFIAAASRVRQLREQRKYGEADKIQRAVESAYETLASDPNLAKDFKEKHVSAMKNFNEIVSGKQGRVLLREYGDSTEAMLNNENYDAATMRFKGGGGLVVPVTDDNGKVVMQNGQPQTQAVEVKIKDVYMNNGMKFAPENYVAPDGAQPVRQEVNITVNPAAGGIAVPNANAGKATIGMDANSIAKMIPSEVNMIWQSAQAGGGPSREDLIKLQAAIDASGKDYGDLERQVNQAFDQAGLRAGQRMADAQQRVATAQPSSGTTYVASASGGAVQTTAEASQSRREQRQAQYEQGANIGPSGAPIPLGRFNGPERNPQQMSPEERGGYDDRMQR